MRLLLKRLFATQSITETIKKMSGNQVLARTLGPGQLTMMGIGAIIGAGIFVLTGTAAAQFAGPAVVLSFLVALIPCFFAALCYAEFSALIPTSGTAYAYTYHTMGEFVAWIVGWSLSLEYLFSCGTLGVGFSGYFVSLMKDIGITIPAKFTAAPYSYDAISGWVATGSYFDLPAMTIIALVGILIACGTQGVAKINNLLVVIKMTVILLFVGIGLFFVKKANWFTGTGMLGGFIPENTGIYGVYGLSGILRGAGYVFFAFIGFDSLASLSQETKNPQKSLPIGMLASLFISALAFVLVALVITGVVNYTQLNVSFPAALVVEAFGPAFNWLSYVINGGILAALISVILVMMLGQTRIFMAMSDDGLIPKRFASINAKTKAPLFGTVFTTLLAMALAGVIPISLLASLVSMGTLLIFTIVCFGVLILRKTQPNLPRPFRTPFVPLVPLLGGFSCIALMVSLSLITWVQLGIWLAIGLFVYFGYSMNHSKLQLKLKLK